MLPVLVKHYATNEVLVLYEKELLVRLENLYCARNLKLYASMCAPSWKQALYMSTTEFLGKIFV